MPSLNKEFAKPSWGDDIDDFDQDEITDIHDEDGVFTTTQIIKNDEGKQVKVTRKIKKKLIKEAVQHAVAERKKLKKFGASKNDPAGPQTDTTNISEEIFLKLSSNNKVGVEVEEEVNKPEKIVQSVVCRICKGEHWTIKCPYKNSQESFQALNVGADSKESLASTLSNDVDADAGKSGKYVPPGLRNRTASGQGVRDTKQYDDSNTIRITNLSEDTTDRDLNELVRRFGPTSRIYFKREKGFAFVTFLNREDAEKAIATLNGYGYDSLILHVEWSIRQNKN